MLRILMGLAALGLSGDPGPGCRLLRLRRELCGRALLRAPPLPAGLRRGRACWPRSPRSSPIYDAHIIRSGLTIANIDDIRETKVNVNGPSLIPRRYCHATAYAFQRPALRVVYLIEFQAGFASIHWGVQSCLPGYDPYRVYGAWCRSIRP